MVLQFVRTLSTLLHCHCLFHLAVCMHIVHTSSLSLSVPSCSCTHIVHTSSLSSSVPSCSLYAHCPHFFTVTACSILQFVCTLSTRLHCHCLFHLVVCMHIVHTSSLSLSVLSCSLYAHCPHVFTVIVYSILQFVRTLSTLLHWHCLFHLAVCMHIVHTSSLSLSVPSCSLYAHCPHFFTLIVCSILQLYAHYPHFFTVIVCSILQFVRTLSTRLHCHCLFHLAVVRTLSTLLHCHRLFHLAVCTHVFHTSSDHLFVVYCVTCLFANQ